MRKTFKIILIAALAFFTVGNGFAQPEEHLIPLRSNPIQFADAHRFELQRSSMAFLADTRTQDAVIRNLEIIGEATKSLSTEFKQHFDAIHWKPMAGMRDKLIHEYFGVDLSQPTAGLRW